MDFVLGFVQVGGSPNKCLFFRVCGSNHENSAPRAMIPSALKPTEEYLGREYRPSLSTSLSHVSPKTRYLGLEMLPEMRSALER